MTKINQFLLTYIIKIYYIIMNTVNTTFVAPVETKDEATKVAPSVPTNIYLTFDREEEKTQQAESSFNIFQTLDLINKVKEKVNILHENLGKKSNIFIFGAGGTTSWFLPKLLKIYNDAFNKVPNLRYDLNIVLIDNDIV